MNQYLLLVSVHLKEEYVARKKKEDLGCFVILFIKRLLKNMPRFRCTLVNCRRQQKQ